MSQENNTPLISIITVVYNGAETIEQTIQSVIDQSYKNIEYIIIDGGSTDGSIEIIKDYSGYLKYWVSEKDNGIYDALNKGLKHAKGDIIGILNSNDWYDKNSIEKIKSEYLRNTDVDVFHGLLRFIDENDSPVLVSGHYSSFLDKGMIEHPTCFIKKKLYDVVGEFNTSYKSAADYEWMLRARKMGARFYFISQIITNFRRGGISDSHLGFSEELLIKKRYGLISSFKYSYWKIYSRFLSIINK